MKSVRNVARILAPGEYTGGRTARNMRSAKNVARAAALAAMVISAFVGAANAQSHAPWPTNWNDWNDPALWCPVGNPGNATDTTGYGAVAYSFNMGKFEVTAGQYTAFLNAVAGTDSYGLYNTSTDTAADSFGCNIKRAGSSGSYTYSVAADWANRPVNFVSWGDAARFANWLTNGQPTGSQGLTTTENGAYYLNGATTNAALMAVARIAEGQRTPGKKYYFIPTEDEWYKAAYHKNDGVTGNYFSYPTGTNSVPSNVLGNPTDPGNNATFRGSDYTYTIGDPYYRTEVGDHENSDSPYGTFDQGGNVWEWNESIVSVSYRGDRGGAFSAYVSTLSAAFRDYNIPSGEGNGIGFRVSEVPEPTTMSLLALGGIGTLARRRLRR